jgi:hypothetical protein
MLEAWQPRIGRAALHSPLSRTRRFGGNRESKRTMGGNSEPEGMGQ